MNSRKFLLVLFISVFVLDVPNLQADTICENKTGDPTQAKFEKTFSKIGEISDQLTSDSTETSELFALLREKGFEPGNDSEQLPYGLSLFQKALNDVTHPHASKGEVKVFGFDEDRKTPMSWSITHKNASGEEEIFLIFKNMKDDGSGWKANIALVKMSDLQLKAPNRHDQIKQADWVSLSLLKSSSPSGDPKHARLTAAKESPIVTALLAEAEQNSSVQKNILNENGEVVAIEVRYHSPKDSRGVMRVIERNFKNEPHSNRAAGTTTLTLVGDDIAFGVGPRGALESLNSTEEFELMLKHVNADYDYIEKAFMTKELQDAVVMLGGVGSAPARPMPVPGLEALEVKILQERYPGQTIKNLKEDPKPVAVLRSVKSQPIQKTKVIKAPSPREALVQELLKDSKSTTRTLLELHKENISAETRQEVVLDALQNVFRSRSRKYESYMSNSIIRELLLDDLSKETSLTQSTLKVLLELTKDPITKDPKMIEFRSTILNLFAQTGTRDPKVIQRMIEMLNPSLVEGEDIRVKEVVIGVLYQLGVYSDEATEAVQGLLEDKNPNIRFAARTYLLDNLEPGTDHVGVSHAKTFHEKMSEYFDASDIKIESDVAKKLGEAQEHIKNLQTQLEKLPENVSWFKTLTREEQDLELRIIKHLSMATEIDRKPYVFDFTPKAVLEAQNKVMQALGELNEKTIREYEGALKPQPLVRPVVVDSRSLSERLKDRNLVVLFTALTQAGEASSLTPDEVSALNDLRLTRGKIQSQVIRFKLDMIQLSGVKQK